MPIYANYSTIFRQRMQKSIFSNDSKAHPYFEKKYQNL